MKSITAYKTSDGKFFELKSKALAHQQDIIGELLDDILPDDDRGNVTMSDRFNLLLKMMSDTRLRDKVKALYYALEYIEEGEEL